MDEKEEVEEPKDSIQTLFLGYKKHPKKERKAEPEIEIVEVLHRFPQIQNGSRGQKPHHRRPEMPH